METYPRADARVSAIEQLEHIRSPSELAYNLGLMTQSLVTIELRDSIAIVQLDRPDSLDALSRDVVKDLLQAFNALEGDPKVRAVILSCLRQVEFSAGQMIAEMTTIGEESAHSMLRDEQALFDTVAKSGVPVIAVLNGVVDSNVFELALACHMRFASTNTEFILPHANAVRIPESAITQRLARIFGTGRGLHIPVVGQKVFADEAFRIGLVNRVTDPDNLLSEAEELARAISKLAPFAIRACLEAVRRGLGLPLQEGLAIEAELFCRLFATEDVREGTRAFLEKRTPVFKGK